MYEGGISNSPLIHYVVNKYVYDTPYISVRVARAEKGRYRNRKGDISINVLAVCEKYMNFIYVLSGWKGSAADSRVLRDAVTRPTFSLKVPNGGYILQFPTNI